MHFYAVKHDLYFAAIFNKLQVFLKWFGKPSYINMSEIALKAKIDL